MAGITESRTYDAILSTTLANYRGKLQDNIFDKYPLLSWLNGKLGQALRGSKRKRTLDGGESIVETLLYEVSSAVKAYSQYEQLDVTPQDGITQARFAWRQYAAAISISGYERRVNGGEAQIVDLLKAKTTQAEMSLRRTLSLAAWGANASGKDLDGLGLILSPTATVGGLAPATYGWWAPVTRASGSFAAQGVADMRVVFNTLTYGEDAPGAIFAPQAVYEYFEATFDPKQRVTSTKSVDAGFENLLFRGVPVLFDRHATAGTMSFLNSDYINWCVHRDADFSTGKFITPENQDASTAQILVQGNITISNRRMHGQMTGITA